MKDDSRYQVGVGGIPADEVPAKMQEAMKAAQACFPPETGVAVFAFDRGTKVGGFGWIANANRGDMIVALQEWIRRQRGRN